MSLSVTTDVFCDAPDCLLWVEGVAGREVAAPRDARMAAKRAGWQCDRDGDYCPDHHTRPDVRRPAPEPLPPGATAVSLHDLAPADGPGRRAGA